MKGTPHLLTDVKFDERRKGYDPEQVDNFLERVSGAVAQLQDKLREATARAEEADAKVADAKKAQAVAEARVDKLKADLQRTQAMSVVLDEAGEAAESAGDKADATSVGEEAANVLVMAQKAADATATEAKQQAMTTISDARTKAASIVAEAESQAEMTLAEARRKSSDLLDAQSVAVLEEARSLEATRDRLKQDVAALHGHFDAQRNVLRRQIDQLSQVLDADSQTDSALPELSDASVADLALVDTGSSDAEPGSDAPTTDEPTNDEPTTDELPEAELTKDDSAEVDASESSGAADESDGVVAGQSEPDGSHDHGETQDEGEDAAESSGTDKDLQGPRAEAGSGRDLDLTTERLFGAPDSAEASKQTSGPDMVSSASDELFGSLRPDGPSKETNSALGVPDAKADEAMRAFFEADFDKSASTDAKARFGRRR